jgi:hypothetical protein
MHIKVTNKTIQICLLSRHDLCTLSVLHWNYAFSLISIRPKILIWGNGHWSHIFRQQVHNLEQTPSSYESHTNVILRPPRHLSHLRSISATCRNIWFLNSVHCLLTEHILEIGSVSILRWKGWKAAINWACYKNLISVTGGQVAQTNPLMMAKVQKPSYLKCIIWS